MVSGTVDTCILRSPARVALLLRAAAPPAITDRRSDADRYRLPPSADWQQAAGGVCPDRVRGVPLALDAVRVVRLGERDVLWIPAATQQDVPQVEARDIAPSEWGSRKVFSRELDRQALDRMETGSTTLHGVVVDVARQHRQGAGAGLVYVTRVDEETYDVAIESDAGTVLAATRGTMQPMATPAGSAVLVPDGDQAEVRRLYGARWDLDPREHDVPLFRPLV
jgi:hypothetical protein